MFGLHFKKREICLLSAIIFFAASLRLIGINWDQSNHQHPDERFLTMVATEIRIPPNLANYFNQKESLLNPYNHNFSFYVYGTFPLLLTRMIAEILKMTGYDQIFLIGRYLSVFFETATVLTVFLLSMIIFNKQTKIAFLSAFYYAIAVLPIQQAHFFTVDSFTVFFTTLTVLFFSQFLKKKRLIFLISSGLLYGLTLSSKISIIITFPFFGITLFLFPSEKSGLSKIFYLGKQALGYFIIFFICALISFRIFQPYAFIDFFSLYPNFLQNITDASKMITGEYDYPPNIQWAYTLPFIWPLKNIFFWGLGPVYSLLTISGICLFFSKKTWWKKKGIFFLISFIGIIFLYQAIQLAKYMRYFYPLYPYFALFAGLSVFKLVNFFRQRSLSFFLYVIIGFSLIWPLSFVSIYTRPHSRVIASEWIYKNIPKYSSLTSEEWDDGLPLFINGQENTYKNIGLGIYNTETKDKWITIADNLAKADFLIISSNRLSGSITRYPKRYPVASRYYELLYKEKLGFEKIAQITSYPELINPFNNLINKRLIINDNWAEESFTVYDHPQVYIFKKVDYSKEKFLELLKVDLISSAIEESPAETNYFYRFLKRK